MRTAWDFGIALAVFALALAVVAPAEGISDAQVRRAIIQESIAAYPGSCPCPYNIARNGSRCGRRSAYTRPGGYAPICYEDQVTPAMIQEYRSAHR